MATKKKNSDVQTLDAVDDGAMNDVDEIEGTDTGDNGGNADGNNENTENTEAPQNPDEVSSDEGNDGENDGDDTTIVPMGDDDGDANPLDGDGDDGDDGDEDDDTDYAENFKLRGTELSYPVRDVKAQDRIKELEAEVAELKSDLTELESEINSKLLTITSSSDYNNCNTDGWYRLTGSASNAPKSGTGMVMYVKTYDSTGIMQIAFANGENVRLTIAVRSFYNEAWVDWGILP